MTKRKWRPVVFEPESLHGMQRGINQLANAVRPTLGPLPRTVAVAHPLAHRTPELLDNGGTIARQEGDPAVNGVQLFEGQCLDFPFIRRSDSDAIRLDPECRKAFGVNYQPQLKNGVKILASGYGQLVDLDAGRVFMKFMASGAGNINGEKPKTSDAKL